MIRYEIIIDTKAETAILDYVSYIAVDQRSPIVAARILQRIHDATESLAIFPRRCPIAPESSFSALDIRMLIVDASLILYVVDDTKKAVTVLAFRHGRQRQIRNLGNG